MIDLKELRKLAENAEKDWSCNSMHASMVSCSACDRNDEYRHKFNFAANPATMKTLLDVIEKQQLALKGISYGKMINPEDRAKSALTETNKLLESR